MWLVGIRKDDGGQYYAPHVLEGMKQGSIILK